MSFPFSFFSHTNGENSSLSLRNYRDSIINQNPRGFRT
ncbi:hypothetical protein BCAH1134_C0079 (plasmid) [Bacillus cereus AH1134]|nr:hypothetical protein BCAH1134_C0079 [Bacillus cereus AH1134]